MDSRSCVQYWWLAGLSDGCAFVDEAFNTRRVEADQFSEDRSCVAPFGRSRRTRFSGDEHSSGDYRGESVGC
jgi:hypothetical protein